MDVPAEIEKTKEKLADVGKKIKEHRRATAELETMFHTLRGGLMVLEEIDGDSDDNARADTD